MKLSPADAARDYADAVFRAAFSACRNRADAEDVMQETFLAYCRESRDFASREHLRAWLLRVAINKGKNLTLSFWRRHRVSLEAVENTLVFDAPEDRELFEAVWALPDAYRIVVHLFYEEGYSVREIASLLRLRESTVKSRLHRAREKLKSTLEGWDNDE